MERRCLALSQTTVCTGRRLTGIASNERSETVPALRTSHPNPRFPFFCVLVRCQASFGFFTVVGSALATIVSMTFGFDLLLLLGLISYGIGLLAIGRVVQQSPIEAHT